MLLCLNQREFRPQFISLIVCHVFLCVCLMVEVSKRDFYVLEPITFVIFLYWMLFVFTPILNILGGDVEVFGVNTMDGCAKATSIFMLGYASLTLGYHVRFRLKATADQSGAHLAETLDRVSLLRYSYAVWAIFIGLYIIYNAMLGRSPLYMLSLGLFAKGMRGVSGIALDFLSMLVYAGFVPMLNIMLHSRSRLLKFVVFYITCAPLATRGFRSALIVPLLGPFIFRYVNSRKTPKLRTVLFAMFVFIVVFGVVGNMRTSTRIGDGMTLDGYEFTDGTDGILDYFESYKVFYGAVQSYPDIYGYTGGRQLAYTLTMYIPRAIYPSKPKPLVGEVIANSTSDYAAMAGAASPNIGEYYTDGGIVCVVGAMFVFGSLLRRMKNLYTTSRGSSVAAYSMLLPGLVMMITYGYTAGNLPGILFILLPYVGEKYLVKREVELP